ncbi:hypothetical protein [Streptomyces sp. bgisy027]|uniref:hypothetical protein n=1 Tax=Streptomyces sp. bgisy027 TaxID=3413770 RepID=UPI003D752C5E
MFGGLQFLFDEAEASLEFVTDGFQIQLDWLESDYEVLVAFFAAAAERGYGAFMDFSFQGAGLGAGCPLSPGHCQ